LTDRQTDGRGTDRILIAITRLHYMQGGENVKTSISYFRRILVYSYTM